VLALPPANRGVVSNIILRVRGRKEENLWELG